MEYNEISQLVKLLEKSKLSELSYSDEKCKLILKKAEKQIPAQPQVMHMPYASPPPQGESASVSAAKEKSSASKPQKPDNLKEITSPMVGTYYASPTPGSAPFISKGSKVSKGQVLCIIEAMKLMNEIESDIAGVVEEISLENETPVEFGTVLFKIKPE